MYTMFYVNIGVIDNNSEFVSVIQLLRWLFCLISDMFNIIFSRWGFFMVERGLGYFLKECVFVCVFLCVYMHVWVLVKY